MSAARFRTTRWSIVMAARADGTTQARAALSTLCETYWYPLYAYQRSRGSSEDEAHDVVQGFVVALLERGGVEGASPEVGRFRSYLVGALRNYAANRRRSERTERRGGGVQTFSIDGDDAERRFRDEAADGASPEVLFERRWALTVIDRAVARLRDEYRERGRERFFAALSFSLVGDDRRANYAEIAAGLGVGASAIKVGVHRMRARMRELLRSEVADTVSESAELDDEIEHLFAALAVAEPPPTEKTPVEKTRKTQ